MNSAFAFKTRSELALEHLESLKRPLTDEESDQLRRALHAVYIRGWRATKLAQHRNEELALLAKVEAEAHQADPGRFER